MGLIERLLRGRPRRPPGSEGVGDASGHGDVGAAAERVVVRPQPFPAWQTLPPLHGAVPAMPLVVLRSTFESELTTRRDPRFIAPLDHSIAGIPGGEVRGVATAPLSAALGVLPGRALPGRSEWPTRDSVHVQRISGAATASPVSGRTPGAQLAEAASESSRGSRGPVPGVTGGPATVGSASEPLPAETGPPAATAAPAGSVPGVPAAGGQEPVDRPPTAVPFGLAAPLARLPETARHEAVSGPATGWTVQREVPRAGTEGGVPARERRFPGEPGVDPGLGSVMRRVPPATPATGGTWAEGPPPAALPLQEWARVVAEHSTPGDTGTGEGSGNGPDQHKIGIPPPNVLPNPPTSPRTAAWRWGPSAVQRTRTGASTSGPGSPDPGDGGVAAKQSPLLTAPTAAASSHGDPFGRRGVGIESFPTNPTPIPDPTLPVTVQRRVSGAAPAAGTVPVGESARVPGTDLGVWQVPGSALPVGLPEIQRPTEDATVSTGSEPQPLRGTAGSARGAPAPADGGTSLSSSPSDAVPLDELIQQLFDPLCARIKAELRLDRERSGLLTDLRR